jgi:hypothetical protein
MLPYKVAKQYVKGPETETARFDTLNDAKSFISAKLEEDAALRVAVTYNLYEMGELMESFGQGDTAGASAQSQGGQQQASRQSFSPSPLQTTLRPNGMPPSSFKDVDDKKK